MDSRSGWACQLRPDHCLVIVTPLPRPNATRRANQFYKTFWASLKSALMPIFGFADTAINHRNDMLGHASARDCVLISKNHDRTPSTAIGVTFLCHHNLSAQGRVDRFSGGIHALFTGNFIQFRLISKVTSIDEIGLKKASLKSLPIWGGQ